MNNRIRRVGSVTTGASMIVFGILFILHTVFGILSYTIIYKLWPIILIGLGIEMLISNVKTDNWKYDKGAVIMLILVAILTMCLAGAGLVFDEYKVLFNM